MQQRTRPQGRALAGAAMIVGTSLSIQVAAAIAHQMFGRLSPPGVSALRFSLGALILFVVVRPAIGGRDAATWRAITAYGVCLATLNLTFFEAISLIPMGIAVTLSFVPPLVMALVSARRRLDLLWVALGGAGVATLSGIDPPRSLLGVAAAVAAGVAWVGVAYAGRSLVQRTRLADGLALALPIAALITLPFGAGHVSQLNPGTIGIGLLIAVGGLILPYTLELEGLRRLAPRTVAVIYSVDPAIAAGIGLLVLGQRMTGLQIAGLLAVVAASAGVTLATDGPAPTGNRSPKPSPGSPTGRPNESAR